MHQIFGIHEVLVLILSCGLDKRTLNAAARTGTALHEVALDILWKDLESIAPLLLLLRDLEQSNVLGDDNKWVGPIPLRVSDRANHNVQIGLIGILQPSCPVVVEQI